MTEDQYTDSADVSQLEQRIDELEDTIRNMLPNRRDVLKAGGAAALGAAAMSGSASAGSSQVGTIGDSNNLVDVEAEDIDVSDTLTTQDIVVNGTATGPFGSGGVVLESGDTITVEVIDLDQPNQTFQTLYDGTPKDVLGGVVAGAEEFDFLYTFSDDTTLRKNGSGTSYSAANKNRYQPQSAILGEIDFLPPALDVKKVEVGGTGAGEVGAEIILKD